VQRFPVSDHSNGRTFHNPSAYRLSPAEQPRSGDPATDPGFSSILAWQTSLRPRWPNDFPARKADPLPALQPGQISASFINHSSFVLRIGRKDQRPLVILTDPILSERCSPFRHFGPKRVIAPGFDLSDIPKVDLVLVSHCHYDHLDRPTLRQIARRDRPLCLAPLGNRRHLRGLPFSAIVTRDWWETVQFDAITVTVTPALHGSARTPFDTDRALWGGFMLDTGARRVFFAGDTAHGHHWADMERRLATPDLALLPIGAYEPVSLMRDVHMTPEQAVEAAIVLKAKRAVAMHFGTFQLTDEGYWEPGGRLANCLNTIGRGSDWFTLPRPGESLVIP